MKNISIHGDCEVELKKMKNNCIDTIITDPPYAIKFKGNKWDYKLPSVDVFSELHRVIKPGGTMLCFGGTRTFHRLACNIEDAGFYISDVIMWVYGQGFPKSVDIAYMIDKKIGKFGEVKQKMEVGKIMDKTDKTKTIELYNPLSSDAEKWNGWGTALKPSWEPIVVCNKHIEGNYEDNAISNGVCGLWIDGCRIGRETFGIQRTASGRFPTNSIYEQDSLVDMPERAKRYFYCPKASKKERDGYNTHQTLKPLELIRYLCRLTKTPDGGIVLDPYAGSGTLAEACIKENRDFIVIEKEKEHYEIIKTRIKKLTEESK